MTWLAWRQFRTQSIVAVAAAAVLAIVLVITGIQLAHLYDTSGIAACQPNSDCQRLVQSFVNHLKAARYNEPLYFGGIVVLYAVPAIIGMFWGAPLITREIETGTFRLAWNQSVTKTRWLAVKLVLVGGAAMATAGLFSLMVTWWAGPIDRMALVAGAERVASLSRIEPLVFAARGIAPVGYAAFAFSLGVTAGVLIRRTLPAMATTAAVFAAVQIAMANWIRPHLIQPLRAISPLDVSHLEFVSMQSANHMTVMVAATKPGAWVLSNLTITPSGHVFTGPATKACLTGSPTQCNAWLAGQHLRQLLTYQPASQPVLGLAVVRDRDLPGRGDRAGRVLRLVDPPPQAGVTTSMCLPAPGRAPGGADLKGVALDPSRWGCPAAEHECQVFGFAAQCGA